MQKGLITEENRLTTAKGSPAADNQKVLDGRATRSSVDAGLSLEIPPED